MSDKTVTHSIDGNNLFTLACKECGASATPTGVLYKTCPPKYQYKCEQGHLSMVSEQEATREE